MKKMVTFAMASLLFAAATNVVLAQAPPAEKKEPLRKERQERQQQRINQGVKSGELTTKEAMKLERKQGAIAQDIRDAKKSGGVVTAKEKARIQHEQNNASKQIYKEKHDAQKKP